MKIKDCRGILKVGDRVRTNGNGEYGSISWFEGYVGEINGNDFFVWQNEKEGTSGSNLYLTKGYKYSWVISFSNPNEIEIVSNASSEGKKDGQNIMKLNNMMKRLLDVDIRKLIRAGLINGDLKLTDEGKEALSAIEFEANKKELVAMADEIIAEEKDK